MILQHTAQRRKRKMKISCAFDEVAARWRCRRGGLARASGGRAGPGRRWRDWAAVQNFGKRPWFRLFFKPYSAGSAMRGAGLSPGKPAAAVCVVGVSQGSFRPKTAIIRLGRGHWVFVLAPDIWLGLAGCQPAAGGGPLARQQYRLPTLTSAFPLVFLSSNQKFTDAYSPIFSHHFFPTHP